MNWEIWATSGIIVATLTALATNLGPPDMLLMGGTVCLGLLGILDAGEVFAGFVNPAVLTIAALYVVAAAMRETGAMDRVSALILGRARTERDAFVRMTVPITVMSAFLNNTPIVAMFVPLLRQWCRHHGVSPSRLLIPLSYLAILGGTCTLVGTSTNLVVNGLILDAVNKRPALGQFLEPLSLFELSPLGVPFAVVGFVYLLLVGRRLLPDRKDLIENLGNLRREYLLNMRIGRGCRLADQSVEGGGLRHLSGLFLTEVVRGEQVIAPVQPDLILRADDVLTFTGVVGTIIDLERIHGLIAVTEPDKERATTDTFDRSLCEAVVSSTSPLIGLSVRDADFRARYNAAILAVHRGGERLRGRVGDIVVQSGDALLLQTGPHFTRAHRNNPDFCLVSGIEEARPVRHEKSLLSIGLLGGLLILIATGVVPIVLAAFLIAGLMVATRCISAGVARQAVDWQTLLTIGAALALGKALEKTGCAELVSAKVVQAVGSMGPHVILAFAYLATTILSEIITNRAAAVLMFPVALGIAGQMGLSPRPFVMAIMFAAASTFVTPLGYQTNLMVYGPGGYRYTDFVRVGLPLSLSLLVLATVLVPVIWPF